MITERVFEKGEASLPDILLAVLEQQKTGVFHHDVKDDNVIFDGTLARLIDYDQSDYREEMKTLLPKDSIEYFIDKQTSNWVDDCNIPAFGKNFYEALKNSLSYFDGENFDFEQTTLYEKLSKNSKGGFPYYEISEPGIFARGEKNIADIRQVLDKISFSIGERVLDFGCNTGTLSFYLESRGCDVYSFDSDKNAMICTKILSNIINRKCTVLNLDLKRNCFPKDYDTVLLLNDDFYSKFKIEKIRNAKKRTQRFIAKVYDLERTKKLRGYEVTKTFPVEGEDFFIVVLEKVRKPKAQV